MKKEAGPEANGMGDIIFTVILLLLFAAAGIKARDYSGNAKVFPLFCCGLGILFSLISLINTILKEKQGKLTEKSKTVSSELRKKMLLIFGLILTYVILIKYLGWGVSTTLFLLAFTLILGVPGWNRKKIVIICLIVSAVYFLIFKTFMKINLPTGYLI